MAVLYAYAHYQHNALGTRPLKTHAERLVDQYPALVEASDWVCQEGPPGKELTFRLTLGRIWCMELFGVFNLGVCGFAGRRGD